MCRAIKILPVLLLFQGSLFSQTYSFTYNCLYHNGDSEKSITKTADSSFQLLKDLFTNEVRIIYEIESDGQFMILHGKIDSAAGFLRINASNDEAIIDIRNKLIYLPDEKVVKKIKPYALFNDSIYGDCITKRIQSKSQDYRVEVCKSLPDVIFPPLLFTHADYGVQSISAPGLKLVLLSYRKIKHGASLLYCKKFFTGQKVSGMEYDFFSQ